MLSARSIPATVPRTTAGWGRGCVAGCWRLDEELSRLSRWVGGRLDIEVPAIAVSVGVHAVFLLVLATAGYAVHTEARREFQSQVVDTAISNELTHSDFQDLDQTAEPPR